MLVVTNPANDEKIGSVEETSETVLQEMFSRLKKAPTHSLAERKDALLRVCAQLESNREDLAQLLSLEVGKPIKQARAEIAGTINRAQFFIDHIDDVAQTKTVYAQSGVHEAIQFEPLGLILCISAWNYPYFVSTNVLFPALLAGCRVIFKPSELSLLSGQRLGHLIANEPAFRDSFAVALGGKSLGARLVDIPFDGIFFTGSERAGFSIKKALNDRMVLSQFELGGKDAAYICSDCDLEKTVESVVDGSFYNCGQGCCSIERIYVEENIAQPFTKLFVEAVKKLKIGPPSEESTYIGPLTRKDQVAFLEKQVLDAKNKGARIATGGFALKGKGNYFAPTVVLDAHDSMEVMAEESFGPIVAIAKVKTDEEAIQKINQSRFGLTAAVYSQNQTRAEHILNALQVGTVYWNCCDRVSPRLPWSGRKNSGLGVTLSELGLAAFYRPKSWHKKKM